MSVFNILCVALLLTFITACNQRPASGDETSPGPATETDKQRYNLNPSDELLYEPLDSLEIDSLGRDTTIEE